MTFIVDPDSFFFYLSPTESDAVPDEQTSKDAVPNEQTSTDDVQADKQTDE